MSQLEKYTGKAVSRRQLMLLTGGSAISAAVLVACGSDSSTGSEGKTSEFGDGDVGILNYLLTLEYLESALFTELVKTGFYDGRQLAAMRKFGEEETEHISALVAAVEGAGGDPIEKPQTKLQLNDSKSALELASQIENLVASAYLEEAPKIESAATMEMVLTIHSVEGRHGATTNAMVGESLTPQGEFAQPASEETVLRSLEPFLPS